MYTDISQRREEFWSEKYRQNEIAPNALRASWVVSSGFLKPKQAATRPFTPHSGIFEDITTGSNSDQIDRARMNLID